MKHTAKENTSISQAIARALGITFRNEEFSLGKWGDVDNWCELSHDTLVFLECERNQKHPNTNVLKLYPWLEEFPKANVILLHYFFPENKAPKNRVALCNFMGDKMERNFSFRFQYVPLHCPQESIAKELEKHDRLLMKFIPKKKINPN